MTTKFLLYVTKISGNQFSLFDVNFHFIDDFIIYIFDWFSFFKLNEDTSYGKTNTSLARQFMFTAIVLSGVFGRETYLLSRETYLHRPREVCYNYLHKK